MQYRVRPLAIVLTVIHFCLGTVWFTNTPHVTYATFVIILVVKRVRSFPADEFASFTDTTGFVRIPISVNIATAKYRESGF